MVSRQLINEFLETDKIAIVGVSRNKRDFSRSLYSEFKKRGYTIFPVNPNMDEIEGVEVYSNLIEIDEDVEAVLILTPPKITDQIVQDCHKAGITLVWMQSGVGKGSVSKEAVTYCEENDMEVISGYCPFMFFPDTGFIHKIHAFLLKLLRSYPK